VQILNSDNVTPSFDEGDCGILLKADGKGFQLFNLAKDLTVENMTELQKNNGELLIALAMVVQNDKLREMVLRLTRDVMGDTVNAISATSH
jgi:hypothetical protein